MPFGTGPPWSILRPHHPHYPLPAPPGSPWGNILTPQAPPSTRTPTSGPLWTSFRAKKHEISRNHPTSPHGTHGTILDNQVLHAFGAPYGTNEGTEYWVLLHLASHRPRLLGRRSSGRRRAAKDERNEYTHARGAPSASSRPRYRSRWARWGAGSREVEYIILTCRLHNPCNRGTVEHGRETPLSG